MAKDVCREEAEGDAEARRDMSDEPKGAAGGGDWYLCAREEKRRDGDGDEADEEKV